MCLVYSKVTIKRSAQPTLPRAAYIQHIYGIEQHNIPIYMHYCSLPHTRAPTHPRRHQFSHSIYLYLSLSVSLVPNKLHTYIRMSACGSVGYITIYLFIHTYVYVVCVYPSEQPLVLSILCSFVYGYTRITQWIYVYYICIYAV